MGARTKLSVDRVYELYELFASDENISIADIANMESISVVYVKKLFSRISKNGDLKTRSAKGIFSYPIADDLNAIQEIKELRETGFTYQQIGDYLNLSKAWIYQLDKRNNGVLSNVG